MKTTIRIGLIGNYNAAVRAHIAIPNALHFASEELGLRYSYEWIETESLTNGFEKTLADFDGLWCIPASPYKSMQGALNGIRYAREHQVPFLGSCGGFQHTVIEYVRNVLGKKDADHAESNPDASFKLIAPLSCSLVGATGTIKLEKKSRAAEIYGVEETIEEFHCNYGLNPDFEILFNNSDFKISGRDLNNEVRIIEHITHPFMISTLFQPELSAYKNIAHPVIKSYLSAAAINK